MKTRIYVTLAVKGLTFPVMNAACLLRPLNDLIMWNAVMLLGENNVIIILRLNFREINNCLKVSLNDP